MVRLCTDLGIKEVQEYTAKLYKLRKDEGLPEPERSGSAGLQRVERKASAGIHQMDMMTSNAPISINESSSIGKQRASIDVPRSAKSPVREEIEWNDQVDDLLPE